MKKFISLFLAFVTILGCFSFSMTVSAASVKNTGSNAMTFKYPSAGEVVPFDEALTARWFHYNGGKGVHHYWITVREDGDDGAKIYNQSVGTKTSFTLKKSKLKPDTTYKLYIAAHDANNNVLAKGSAYQVIYFRTRPDTGLTDYYPELNIGGDFEYEYIDDETIRAVSTEYIAPKQKLKLEWDDAPEFDKYSVNIAIYASLNDDKPVVIYDKESTSRTSYKVSDKRVNEDTYICVTLQGFNKNGSYSPSVMYYLWIGNNKPAGDFLLYVP